MTALNHVADDAGAEHFCVRVTKVRALLAEGGAEPVDEDDITHTVVRHGIGNDFQSPAGSEPPTGSCLILPRCWRFISSLKYQCLPYTRGQSNPETQKGTAVVE